MVGTRSVEPIEEPAARTPSDAGDSDSSQSDSGQKKLIAEAPAVSPQQRSRGSVILTPFRRQSPDAPDGRFEELGYESVADYPLGYPSWAAYQNSTPTFRIYKRFGTLRNRAILHRQHRLARLEKQLLELDKADNDHHNHRIRSVRRDEEDNDSKRTNLMEEIVRELKEYDELLEREQRSGRMQKPTKRNYRSLVNYLWNRKPFVKSEMEFLKHQDDFVMLSEDSESPIERIIDSFVYNFRIEWIRNLFSEEAQLNKIDKSQDKYTILTSTNKIRRLARITASLLAILVIGVPLYFLSSKNVCDRTKVAVLLASLVIFPAAISLAARPKNLDLFAATATYCAVLSTFLAASNGLNFGPGGPNPFQNTYNGTLFH